MVLDREEQPSTIASYGVMSPRGDTFLGSSAISSKIDAKDGEISLVAITSPTKLRHKVKMSQDIQGAWNDMPMDPNAMDSITGFSAKLFLSLYHVLNSSKGTQS